MHFADQFTGANHIFYWNCYCKWNFFFYFVLKNTKIPHTDSSNLKPQTRNKTTILCYFILYPLLFCTVCKAKFERKAWKFNRNWRWAHELKKYDGGWFNVKTAKISRTSRNAEHKCYTNPTCFRILHIGYNVIMPMEFAVGVNKHRN